MRKIEFRGKTEKSGDWIYGGYGFSTKNPKVYITAHRAFFLVKPETVGQFTGFKDIDDNKIFEGDIIQYADENEGYKVEWRYGAWVVGFYDDDWNLIDVLDNTPVKVIGNIHDNPELLGSGESV